MALLRQSSPSRHSGSPHTWPARPHHHCSERQRAWPGRTDERRTGVLRQSLPSPSIDQPSRNIETACDFADHRAWCESRGQYLGAIFQRPSPTPLRPRQQNCMSHAQYTLKSTLKSADSRETRNFARRFTPGGYEGRPRSSPSQAGERYPSSRRLQRVRRSCPGIYGAITCCDYKR